MVARKQLGVGADTQGAWASVKGFFSPILVPILPLFLSGQASCSGEALEDGGQAEPSSPWASAPAAAADVPRTVVTIRAPGTMHLHVPVSQHLNNSLSE